MENEILGNHKRYLERKKLYQNYGFDIDKERRSIFDKAGPVSGRILEVGTGKGHFTFVLAGEGHRFTSIDVSEEEQKIARLNLQYFHLEDLVDFRVENAERLSFKDRSFNIVFSVNTIHHLKNPFRVMDEINRVVDFGGRIILADFNKAGFEVLDRLHAAEGNLHDVSGFNLRDMSGFLSGKGFKIEVIESGFQEMLIADKPGVQKL